MGGHRSGATPQEAAHGKEEVSVDARTQEDEGAAGGQRMLASAGGDHRGKDAAADLGPGQGRAWRSSTLSLSKAGLVVLAASLGSKVLGFFRDLVLARQFGSGADTGAYIIAAQIPLTLFAAVGVGITTVFIPMFSKLLASGDAGDAEVFAARVNGLVTAAVALLIIVLEAGAGPAVFVMASGFSPPERALTISLVRIMAPLILFYGWSGVVGGVLNVRGFFGPNAAMGIPQNLVIIASILLASLHGRDIRWVAWGSLVGTLTTYLIQLPALRRSRFPVQWRWDFMRDPRLAMLAGLAVPTVLTALAQQFAILVDRALGSSLGPGLLSDLTWASRLQLLAYAIPGLSIATVLYPSLAASVGRADLGAFRRTFIRGLGLVSFVTVPVTVGLFLLRAPVVRVLFQHGHFAAGDTRQTAYALAFLTLGTFGYGWQDYLNRAFFALQDTRTPMIGAFIAVGVNVVLDLILLHPLRQGGLALGTACGWTCAAMFLASRLRRRLGLLGGRQWASATIRMAGAAVLGFVPAVVLYARAPSVFAGAHEVRDAAVLVVAVCVSAGLYALGCRLLRVQQWSQAVAMARAWLDRGGGLPAGEPPA